MIPKHQKILTTRKVETQTVDWIVERADLFFQSDTKNIDLITSPTFELGATINKTSNWTLSFSVVDSKLGVYLNLESVLPSPPPSTAGLHLALQPPEVPSVNIVSNYTLQVGKPSEDFLPLVFHKNNRIFTTHEGFGTPSMTSIKDLFARKHEFFHNNSLQIRLLITLISDPAGMCIPGHEAASPRKNSVILFSQKPLESTKSSELETSLTLWRNNFGRLYNNRSFADLIVHCGSKNFYCHKLILEAQAADTTKLQNLLNTRLEKSKDSLKLDELNLVHVQEPTLEALLKYVYTGDLEQILSILNSATSLESINSVFVVADSFGIVQLREIVLEHLLEVLNDKSAALAFGLFCGGPQVQNEKISKKVLAYCRRNLEQLLKIALFREAALASPKFLLSTDIGDAEEDENFNGFTT